MMKTNLIVDKQPKIFNELLNQFIQKAEKEGYIIRDIKYVDNKERYSALLILVKLNK